MSYFRKYWPLVLLIVIGLIWWRIVDVLTPPEINDDQLLKTVDYWSTVANPNFSPIALVVAIGIALLTHIWIVRFSKLRNPYRSILIIITTAICIASIMSGLNFIHQSGSGRTIKHVMSVEYQGKTYHLAFSDYFSTDTPDYIPRYHVFECDLSGNTCTQIHTKDGDFDAQAGLMVAGDRLALVHFGEQDQIFPPVQ